jgi:hypothetical protein
MEVSGQIHAPAALLPGKEPRTQWIGGWEGPEKYPSWSKIIKICMYMLTDHKVNSARKEVWKSSEQTLLSALLPGCLSDTSLFPASEHVFVFWSVGQMLDYSSLLCPLTGNTHCKLQNIAAKERLLPPAWGLDLVLTTARRENASMLRKVTYDFGLRRARNRDQLGCSLRRCFAVIYSWSRISDRESSPLRNI